MSELINDRTTSFYYHVHQTMIAALAPTQPINTSDMSIVHLMGLKIRHNQTKHDHVNELLVTRILQNQEKKEEAQSFGSDMHLVVFKSKLVRHTTVCNLLVKLTMFKTTLRSFESAASFVC